jgi:hypothetical protein
VKREISVMTDEMCSYTLTSDFQVGMNDEWLLGSNQNKERRNQVFYALEITASQRYMIQINNSLYYVQNGIGSEVIPMVLLSSSFYFVIPYGVWRLVMRYIP